MNASLLEFARIGHLGSIRIGMSAAEVESIAGPSDGTSNQIWRYGAIELHWDASKLWMIFWDDFRYPLEGGPIKLDPWFVKPGVTIQEVEASIRGERLSFRRGFNPLLDQHFFRLASGFQFMCTREDEEDHSQPILLCGFQLTIDGPHPHIQWTDEVKLS